MQGTTNVRKIDIDQVVKVVRAAGGSLVGRTRLQKTIYLLELAGYVDGFQYEYRHYGPYSEDLTTATLLARMDGCLKEEERTANWGGTYSIYKVEGTQEHVPAAMQTMIHASASANPIALELAATAAYLASEGYKDPWRETAERKPEKENYIDAAKELYTHLSQLDTPRKLPTL